MPSCNLIRLLKLPDGQTVSAVRPGMLLSFGDRWQVIDPADNNVLIDGMTTQFKDWLIGKGWLTLT